MKVFVTGGSGYIGKAVIRALRERGHAVTALARTEDAVTVVRAVGADPVPGGLGDLVVLARAAADAQAVVHLAEAGSGAVDIAAATAMQDGVGAGAYVHTGGVWVYGNTRGVADETAEWNPPPLVAWRSRVQRAVLERAERGGRPIIVQPGLVYGGENRLIERFFTEPGLRRGAISYVGSGGDHWALVHIEDVARLYVAALGADPGSVYIGVGGVNPTAKQVAEAVSHAVGLAGRTRSITLEQAREQMGDLADAFVLDQQFTSAHATADLGWVPEHTDPSTELARR